jgi:hypothetical protein
MVEAPDAFSTFATMLSNPRWSGQSDWRPTMPEEQCSMRRKGSAACTT